MRSIEDKNCLNHESVQENPGGGAIGFDFHRGNGSMSSDFHKANGANRTPHHRTALGKPTPSKWDDAQKWLVNLSRGGERHHSKNEPRNSNADDRRLIVPVPKKEYSSSEDEEGNHGCVIPYGVELETKTVDFCDNSMWRVNNEAYGIPNPNSNSSGVRSICVRDMGTEMTPIASQEPSRTATPVRATTPAARSPIASGSSTPVRFPNGTHNVESCQMAENNRMGGSTTRFGRETEESVVDNVPENTNLDQPTKLNPLETRAMAWDEAERAKYMARYKSEEVKIQAWENHQKRKAEMEMKRTEAKAERLKSRAQEKYTNKLASTRRIAEEKRAKAEATLNEKAVRTSERADYIRRTGHLPSSFSIKLPSCCW